MTKQTAPGQIEVLVAEMRKFANACIERYRMNAKFAQEDLHTEDTYEQILDLCNEASALIDGHVNAQVKAATSFIAGEGENIWGCGHGKWSSKGDCVTCLSHAIDYLNGELSKTRIELTTLQSSVTRQVNVRSCSPASCRDEMQWREVIATEKNKTLLETTAKLEAQVNAARLDELLGILNAYLDRDGHSRNLKLGDIIQSRIAALEKGEK